MRITMGNCKICGKFTKKNNEYCVRCLEAAQPPQHFGGSVYNLPIEKYLEIKSQLRYISKHLKQSLGLIKNEYF